MRQLLYLATGKLDTFFAEDRRFDRSIKLEAAGIKLEVGPQEEARATGVRFRLERILGWLDTNFGVKWVGDPAVKSGDWVQFESG